MFTLEAFGHVNVSVLDGGLPMWLKLGLPVEIGDDEKMTIGGPPSSSKRKESVTPSLKKKRKTKRTDLQWTLKDVQDNIVTKKYQLVDVRPSPRYNGKMKESRPNTRSGHVPGSFNDFHELTQTLRTGAFRLLSRVRMIELHFREAGVQLEGKIAFMCGRDSLRVSESLLWNTSVSKVSSTVYDGSCRVWFE